MADIDCRTCGNYSAHKNKCLSTVQCQAGTQYRPTWAVQCWMRHDDAPDAWTAPAIPTGDASELPDSAWPDDSEMEASK